jgi:uncharacterized membrane-anchored protein YhcB (DUF1043 family)
MNAILLASAGLIILLVGGGVGFWLGRSGVGGSKARVEKAEAELNEYKRSVTDHFGQTAAHFQAIGKEYRELYEHMSNGAQALCDADQAGQPLLFAPGADSASTNAEEPAAEVTTADQEAEMASEIESAESDVADRPVSETAADSRPEAEERDRILH